MAVTQRGTATTSSGASNPETVAVPTGTVAGDRVILVVSVDDDGSYTTVTATAGAGKNFTALGHTGGGSGATEWLTVFERIWDGTESGTISVAGSTSDHYLAATSWQGADSSAASTLGTFANTSSVSAVPAVSNGTADDYTLLCVGTNNIDRSAGAPSGWTRLASIGGAEIDGQAFGASGSTGTVTPSWTGTGEFAAVLVSIPAPSGPSPTLEQEGYRWRNDDGSETTATWAASQDADVTAPLSANVRLRSIVNATLDPATAAYTLNYKLSTDSVYVPVPVGATVALPTYVDKGTFTSGTGALSVPAPAGIQANDVLILAVESANQAITAPTGYTEVTDSPQSTGTAALAGGVRVGVFYKVTSGTESNVTVADTGNHTTAIITAYRGCDPTTPIHATNGSVDSSATSSLSCPAVTTTVGNCMIVNLIGLDKDLADSDTLSSEANASLANVTERHDQTVSSGVGGGLAVITGELASAGSSGSTTATGDTSTTHAYVTIALAPAPVSVYVSPSSNITAGGVATTAQLTAPSGKTTSNFTTGRMWDDENGADSIDIASGNYTELEWSLQAQSPAAAADVYQFRVYAGSTPLDTYTLTPQWTIGTGGGSGPSTQTDTGSGTETQSIVAAIPQTDTGTGSDSYTLSTSRTQTDTGSGLEGTPSIRQALTDTGSGTETWSIVVTITQTDTGSGADSQTIAASLTQTDTGSGADSGSVSVLGSSPPTQTDTGSGTETQSIVATQTQTDTGSGTEVQSIVTSRTQTDTGSGTEAAPKIGQSQTDTGSSSDAFTLATSRTLTDTGTGTETWSITVRITQTDTGVGTDDFQLANGVPQFVVQTDVGTSIEGWSVTVNHPADGAPGYTRLSSMIVRERIGYITRRRGV